MNPDVIKAAATSPLGVLALMVMVLSTIALTFFGKADARTKLAVFVMLLLGVAGFATVVLLQAGARPPAESPRVEPSSPPVTTEPAEAASGASAPAALPTCRTRENGVERWGKTELTSADSGWRGGGSSPAEYCAGELRARVAKLGDAGEVQLVNTSEDSKDINPPFNVRRYRYRCTFAERTDPVFKLAASAACAKPAIPERGSDAPAAGKGNGSVAVTATGEHSTAIGTVNGDVSIQQ